MGLIGTILGRSGTVAALGEAAKGVAEVFTPSASKQMELNVQAQTEALQEFADEFDSPAVSGFDRLVNGLNRLPRPFLAFGTLGLFLYAMVDPQSFALRMVGLNAVPEPLWWLLGAVVAFYFGARETHYFRSRPNSPVAAAMPVTAQMTTPNEVNAALTDWRAAQQSHLYKP
jgi:Holin of 3TMs, for gene-transfer release